MGKTVSKEDFFKKCCEIHNNKYVYHNDYESMNSKILITCPIHGDFYQYAKHHVNGCGCKDCSHKSTKYTNDEFLSNAIKVHGNKYNYLSEYVARNKKIKIECPLHGVFYQTPYSHLSGSGCPKCSKIVRSDKLRMGIEKFIEKAKKVHGNAYDYSKIVDYINNSTKVPIICKKHGVFFQTINKHLTGCGCPLCSGSKLEKEINNVLNENKIKFIPQYNLKENKRQKIDFYLPDYNVAIEFQGGQHFQSVEYFGGEKEFERRKKLDEFKKEFCKNNGIKLFYYSNLKYDNFLGEKIYNSVDELLRVIKGSSDEADAV